MTGERGPSAAGGVIATSASLLPPDSDSSLTTTAAARAHAPSCHHFRHRKLENRRDNDDDGREDEKTAQDPDPYSSRPHHRRTSSASEILRHAAQALESKLEKTLLLLFDELPSWRRDNPSILTGYRPESGSFKRSFLSLFYLHNESVNIWSHLLGSAGFLGIGLVLCWLAWGDVVRYAAVVVGEGEKELDRLESWGRSYYDSAGFGDVVAFACFLVGAVVCLGMSAVFHATSNHSEGVNRWANKLDYTGIVVLVWGSYVPALYYAFGCGRGDGGCGREAVLMGIYLAMVSRDFLFFFFF